MIFDDLEKLYEYNLVSPEVIEFIGKLTVDTPDGKYSIDDKTYVNIDSYNRRGEYDAPLEAHRKYIDLQLLISGVERIDFTNIDGLKEFSMYDPVKDIIFYKRPHTEIGSLYLNGRNFAIFFPQDAHAPQITTLSLQNNVKKAVVKIPVEYL